MSEEELQVLRELNERQRREEEKKAARLAEARRVAKGCLIGFAIMGFLFLATCVAILGGDAPEDPPLAIDERAVLEEMRGHFESGIARVQVAGRATSIRIDVFTDLYPDRDVAEIAQGIALIAAQSNTLLQAYPTTTIESRVWPRNEEFYMTRASASYTNGTLDGPIDSYTNSVLR